MSNEQLDSFMDEAIAEGRKALPKCFPNPPVGCVIVKDNQIISKGHTQEPGNHHAEAMALALLSDENEEFSMFVTLEPCSFKGRTPSCAKAIIEKKVKEVYVGIIDPHPKNQGAGIRLLKEAGISVEVGILSKKIHKELDRFLLKGL